MELKEPKTYRLIVTYSGFDETKDAKITTAAGKSPSQRGYDPVEARRTIDFCFRSKQGAGRARARIVVEQQKSGGFSVSRVIDDTF
jgi:hypothetical protein